MSFAKVMIIYHYYVGRVFWRPPISVHATGSSVPPSALPPSTTAGETLLAVGAGAC